MVDAEGYEPCLSVARTQSVV